MYVGCCRKVLERVAYRKRNNERVGDSDGRNVLIREAIFGTRRYYTSAVDYARCARHCSRRLALLLSFNGSTHNAQNTLLPSLVPVLGNIFARARYAAIIKRPVACLRIRLV